MDEQENGKIGFNYVHFLFSIGTSEKHRFELQLQQQFNPSSWRMNGINKTACGSTQYVQNILKLELNSFLRCE